jgi:hypothetical protein
MVDAYIKKVHNYLEWEVVERIYDGELQVEGMKLDMI